MDRSDGLYHKLSRDVGFSLDTPIFNIQLPIMPYISKYKDPEIKHAARESHNDFKEFIHKQSEFRKEDLKNIFIISKPLKIFIYLLKIAVIFLIAIIFTALTIYFTNLINGAIYFVPYLIISVLIFNAFFNKIKMFREISLKYSIQIRRALRYYYIIPMLRKYEKAIKDAYIDNKGNLSVILKNNYKLNLHLYYSTASTPGATTDWVYKYNISKKISNNIKGKIKLDVNIKSNLKSEKGILLTKELDLLIKGFNGYPPMILFFMDDNINMTFKVYESLSDLDYHIKALDFILKVCAILDSRLYREF